MLPYHINMANTSAECMGAPRMNYPTDVAMWNEGRMDRWNIARDPGYGMGYFEREDLPYYYALSDGFTIGDAYHQSTFTETSPNRIHLFSGSNNNYHNPKGRGSNPDKDWLLMNDAEAHNPGYDWPTMAETLEESGVPWKVYMSVGLVPPLDARSIRTCFVFPLPRRAPHFVTDSIGILQGGGQLRRQRVCVVRLVNHFDIATF